MNKSSCYHLAQIAVLATSTISPERKLQILRVLMESEDLEIYREEQELDRLAAELDAQAGDDE